MCGITGFLINGKSNFGLEKVIWDMSDSMAHRGPDDRGFTVLSYDGRGGKDPIVFGHRRLKIIDLSQNAHQPMTDKSGNLAITYNGEIYNYLELKDELIKKGYDFTSSSDTEVALKSYKEWGEGCFERFNGMWALAIFDKRNRKVILSRDRFGKKPLYYYKTKNEFVFASEIKAILKYPGVVKKPNYAKIFRYLSGNYRYVDIDNESYFEGIFQVPKSSLLEISEDLGTKASYYWNLGSPVMKADISDERAVNDFRNILVDSVRIRLRSDVPVGCMLSGGLDSTSITSIAYKVLKNPIVAFSGITGNLKGVYDESEYIDSVIKETNANFHYIRPDPADLFQTIDEMLGFHDEPVCTVTWYSLYLIAKKVRLENVPVVLNGHGGDELLAGYWDHYHYNFYDLQQNADLKTLAYETKAWEDNHHRGNGEIQRYQEYIRDLASGKISEMSRFPDYSDCFKDDFAKNYHKDISWPNPYAGSLSKRLYSETMFETIPASLRPEDRNTMSQSIESRSPFLDHRLVEYCFSLPNKFKIRNGLGKWMLRESMKGILPENVRTRKDKSGFIAPANEWFRTTNRQELYDLINSKSIESRRIFIVDKLNAIYDEHLAGGKNHQMFLWQLINLELWFRKYFDER